MAGNEKPHPNAVRAMWKRLMAGEEITVRPVDIDELQKLANEHGEDLLTKPNWERVGVWDMFTALLRKFVLSYVVVVWAIDGKTLIGGVRRSRSSRWMSLEEAELYRKGTTEINGTRVKDSWIYPTVYPPEIFTHCKGHPSTTLNSFCFGCKKKLTKKDAREAAIKYQAAQLEESARVRKLVAEKIMQKYCVRLISDPPQDIEAVKKVFKEVDPEAVIDTEGNPITFWISTSLPLATLKTLHYGVEDIIHSMDQ